VKIWTSHNNSRGNYEISFEAECPADQDIIEFLERSGDITAAQQTLREIRRILETPEGESVIERARDVMQHVEHHITAMKAAKPA